MIGASPVYVTVPEHWLEIVEVDLIDASIEVVVSERVVDRLVLALVVNEVVSLVYPSKLVVSDLVVVD